MDIKDYKSGNYLTQYQYKSYSPSKINIQWTWTDSRINTLLEEANLKLGALNAFSLTVPDIDIFIRMHVVKEATTSSRIEGTRTGVEDVVMKEENIKQEMRDDWKEVHNYIVAMNWAIEQLEILPLSNRLIKKTHKKLMSGVRGETRLPGEFRRSQNWIGGATLKDATFIPPVHTEVADHMSDLENFLHNESIDVPHLIRISLAHYQFETIHPFLDGNGRLGRLLITLYLVSKGLLVQPTLYLSAYFEKHRDLYYDNLMIVRNKSNLGQWIKFFLVAIIETSKMGIRTFQKILQLKENIEERKLITLGKKLPKAKTLVRELYRNPTVSAADVAELLNVTPMTANALILDLVRLNILVEITGRKRNRIFVFQDYLNLFTE
jgi:Fic family protein